MRASVAGKKLEAVKRQQTMADPARLQALYNFAYGLSHEINNPLANITTRAQLLLVDEPDLDRRKKLTTIVQQAFRAHEMIADLMLFARPPALDLKPTDLCQLGLSLLDELRDVAAAQQTSLSFQGQAAVLTTVDPVQIGVALKALLQNALEAVRASGNIQLSIGKAASSIRSKRAPKIPQISIAVEDNGPGISADSLPHIFDPFYCGREAGRGLGLGLSKAWRIVDLHGGWIGVASKLGVGSRFTITLPIVLPPATPATPSRRSP